MIFIIFNLKKSNIGLVCILFTEKVRAVICYTLLFSVFIIIGVTEGGGWGNLQFVLAHGPQGDSAIRRDGKEIEVLGQVFLLPAHLCRLTSPQAPSPSTRSLHAKRTTMSRTHLPDRVHVLARLDRGLEYRPVEPSADVEDHDCAVIAANGK